MQRKSVGDGDLHRRDGEPTCVQISMDRRLHPRSAQLIPVPRSVARKLDSCREKLTSGSNREYKSESCSFRLAKLIESDGSGELSPANRKLTGDPAASGRKGKPLNHDLSYLYR